MRRFRAEQASSASVSRVGRWLFAALLLCAAPACGTLHSASKALTPRPGVTAGPGSTLPPQAFTGGPQDGFSKAYINAVEKTPLDTFGPVPLAMGGCGAGACACCGGGTPRAECSNDEQWSPPGIARPWPPDEYVCDGGDQNIMANLGPDGELRGIDEEDALVEGETIDGRTMIVPSNRVCIYSPRFAAVRRVEGAYQNEQEATPVGVSKPLLPRERNEPAMAIAAVQPIQPVGDIGVKQPSTQRLRQLPEDAILDLPLRGVELGFAAHEDFLAIREGIYSQLEKASLMESVLAAIVWTHDKAVQVILDSQEAVVETGNQRAQATYTVDVPNNPRLRVIKVASVCAAKPGEIVEFTIRFDNIGDQRIENVTLIDNLTTRLEYVADSAQSSNDAKFSTSDGDGDSLVLRWDFTEPLGAGQGGIVRFKTRVR